MRFGFVLPMLRHRIDPTGLPRLAVVAEEKGFDSVWTADHIAVPQANSETYGDVLEQLVTLTYVAAKTERLKVGTSVLIVPQRNPLIVAKQAAALQILSGGRLILGVGAGWVEGEFKILGADFAQGQDTRREHTANARYVDG
jgi:alkanesulfonate monooxygenase SsuD/methylene tetrahydromethanopterin reductase-like flavin-dependent oxidoreductase (luciferase family)